MAPDERSAGEPWGKRLWFALAAVCVVAVCLQSYGIRTWPMADDEVPSLVELGLLRIDAPAFFSVPPAQIERLPKATIVWNRTQRLLIDLLGDNELSFRIPSVVFGILTSAIAFLLAARWRGLWFAAALSIVLNGSQLFIYLAQLNRFYSLPLLLVTLTLASIVMPWGGQTMIVVSALLAILAILAHNMTAAVFGLAFASACVCYVLGRVRLAVVLRSGAALLVSGLTYVVYLRPLVQGWNSTGNPTPVLISFSAHAGVTLVALALLGCWLSVFRRDQPSLMLWWALVFTGTLVLFQAATLNWNPRYFLFFLPAAWIMSAHSMEFIARRMGHGSAGVIWYGCVAFLLLPSLVSHFQDGSRHDYRQAAAVVMSHVQAGEAVLSDDAETISYYLPDQVRQRLHVRSKVTTFPQASFLLVVRSNAWMPQPQIAHRRMDLLAEIYRRRFDQFSHIVRVYRVAAEPSWNPPND